MYVLPYEKVEPIKDICNICITCISYFFNVSIRVAATDTLIATTVTAVILHMDGHIHAGHGFAGDWEIPRVRKHYGDCLTRFDTQSRPQEHTGIQTHTRAVPVGANTEDLFHAIRWVYEMDMRACRSIYTGLSESSSRHVHFGKGKSCAIDEYCDHANKQCQCEQ